MHNFDYNPTYLGGCSSSNEDYLLRKFLKNRDTYSGELKTLQELEWSPENSVLVKTWILSEDEDHPLDLSLLYRKISKYIKENESDTWVYSHLDIKEEEVYLDYWDDFPRTETHYHLYADILNSDTLEETQVYKDQVEKVIHSLKVLQQSEKEFLDYIKTLK